MSHKRGRPALDDAKRKENMIPVRVDDRDYAEFKREADQLGIPPATLARAVLKRFLREDDRATFIA